MNSKNKTLILIVDDNHQNLQFLGNLLAEKGYEIGVAESGMEALDFMKHSYPDLVLLDIMMPELDGFAVCSKIKENIDTRHIPVIFLTAMTSSEDIVKGFEVGGIDYITKPFIPVELLARVKTQVEMKKLKGLLPICANCKKIRNDDNLWKNLEIYIEENTDAYFSHGICPDCIEELYGKEKWLHKNRSSKD